MPGLPLIPPLRGPQESKDGQSANPGTSSTSLHVFPNPETLKHLCTKACSRTNLKQSGKDLWEENDQTLLRDIRKFKLMKKTIKFPDMNPQSKNVSLTKFIYKFNIIPRKKFQQYSL